MYKDIFDSVKDNFSQKARNPFLATILIVWLCKNWRLVYGLFTFDGKTTQAAKLAYIENYFKTYSFYPNLGQSIWYAFLGLITCYVLVGILRLIVDTYENIVYPRIRKATDHRSIVRKDVHDEALKNLESLDIKYQEERRERIKAQNELEVLEKENEESRTEIRKIGGLNIEIEELHNRLKEYESDEQDLNDLKKEYNILLREKLELQLKLDKSENEKKQAVIDNEEKNQIIITSYKMNIEKLNNQLEEASAIIQKRNNELLGSWNVMRGTRPKSN